MHEQCTTYLYHSFYHIFLTSVDYGPWTSFSLYWQWHLPVKAIDWQLWPNAGERVYTTVWSKPRPQHSPQPPQIPQPGGDCYCTHESKSWLRKKGSRYTYSLGSCAIVDRSFVQQRQADLWVCYSMTESGYDGGNTMTTQSLSRLGFIECFDSGKMGKDCKMQNAEFTD